MIKRLFILFTSFSFLSASAKAQTPFERLGQKAMSCGEFNVASSYFEKAYEKDNANMNALWLMGYSSYHAVDYKKSIEAFDKLLSMKPTETAAYYYRGKAKVLLATSIKDYKSTEREKLLNGAIKDFSAAIDLNKGDLKLYQNRGLAYQEYAFYKSQKVNEIYNKNAAICAANFSISDFKKVLAENGYRRDITAQIEKSKQLLADLK